MSNIVYTKQSKESFLDVARRLAYEVAASVGVIISDADEDYYASLYLAKYPRYGSEMPLRSKMMNVIAEDFAG